MRAAPTAHAQGGAVAWELQLQRAACGQRLSTDDAAKDESCGIPFAPADPLPTRAASEPAPAAFSGESVLPPHTNEGEAQRAPLRVHVHHQPGEGLTVWLGIDGHAALVAQRATAAVADLRRSFSGERIAAVVCNGVPVYTRPDLSMLPTPLEDSP